jgi:hypothetical protein
MCRYQCARKLSERTRRTITAGELEERLESNSCGTLAVCLRFRAFHFLPLPFNASGLHEQKHAIAEKAGAKNNQKDKAVRVGEPPPGKNRSHDEVETVRSGSSPFVEIEKTDRSRRDLDILIDQSNDCFGVLLTAIPTCQTFAEINGAFRTQSFAAGFATSDRVSLMMVKAFHKISCHGLLPTFK